MENKTVFALTLALVFIAGALTSLIVLPELSVERIGRQEARGQSTEWNLTVEPLPEGVETQIVGTTEDNEGVVSSAWVRADPGVGKILVDIENLFFWVDIQNSIRAASTYAKEYLETEEEYDLTYTVDLDASIIGGPSAGGALTVATLAALENSTIREDVVMTGTVEPDGRIGKVGGIVPKAEAADREGFEKFLVPEGQSVQVTYTREESCRSVRNIEICRTEYEEERVNVSEEVDIEVVEVKNIEEALDYFM
ncbi:MAG: S16 family serine protease [Candidatus Aenigmatarchaeota archaeon]